MQDDRTELEKALEHYESLLPKQSSYVKQSLKLSDIPKGVKPDFIIDGYVPEASMILLTGEPGTGKTTIAASWASAVTNGVSWIGHNVMPGNVLYILLEDSMVQSAETLRKFHVNEDKFFVMSQVSSSQPVLHSNIYGSIKLPENTLELIHEINAMNPAMIIVDALTRLVAGKSKQAKETIVMSLADICREKGVALVLLNHIEGKGRYHEKNITTRLQNGMFHEMARVSYLMKYSIEQAIHELVVIKSNIPGVNHLTYRMYEAMDDTLHLQPIGMYHEMLLLDSPQDKSMQQKILGALSLYGALTPIEVQRITQLNYGTLRGKLHEMSRDGIIEHKREVKKYALPSDVITPMDNEALQEVRALQEVQHKTTQNNMQQTAANPLDKPTNTKTFLFEESPDSIKARGDEPDRTGKEETTQSVEQP